MPKVCQDMHKCHNYHAILHKLYMWFGKNELRLCLNRGKKFRLGELRPPRPPLNTPMSIPNPTPWNWRMLWPNPTQLNPTHGRTRPVSKSLKPIAGDTAQLELYTLLHFDQWRIQNFWKKRGESNVSAPSYFYHKCTQWTLRVLCGKRRLTEIHFEANRGGALTL